MTHLPTRAELLAERAKSDMVSVARVDAILPHLIPDDYLIVQVATHAGPLHRRKVRLSLLGGYFVTVIDRSTPSESDHRLIISPRLAHESERSRWTELHLSDVICICITHEVETRIIGAMGS